MVADEKNPAVQSEQTDAFNIAYEPLLHAVHTVIPLAEENTPAWHCMQDEDAFYEL